MRRGLLDRIGRGEVVLFDGALGTELIARGLKLGACLERWTLDRPDGLREIAALYLDAGADVLTTNTFGASPTRLAPHGLGEAVEILNRRAAELIGQVAGERALVAGDVGPSGLSPAAIDPGALEAGFERQIRALAAGGVDLILVETMTDLKEARLAVAAARKAAPELPVIATMTFTATAAGFCTAAGASVRVAARGLEDAGADVIGANCGRGEGMVEVARALAACTRRPLAIQASAGLPLRRGGALVYPDDPTTTAAAARQLLDLGVAILGGCCGTTPHHIRALRALIDRRRQAADQRSAT